MASLSWNNASPRSDDYNTAANWLENGSAAPAAPGPSDQATIGGGAKVLQTEDFNVGDPNGGTGTLTVTDPGTTVTFDNRTRFGGGQTNGTLSVLNDATVIDTDPNPDNFVVGGGPGGEGDLKVEGSGSSVTASYFLDVGHNGGTGTAEVGQGATLQAQGQIEIGSGVKGTNSNGTITVGAGGTLKAGLTPSDLAIYEDQGTQTNWLASIAVGVGPSNTGTLNVTGNGAQVETQQTIDVGAYDLNDEADAGTGTVNIEAGGAVTCGDATPGKVALVLGDTPVSTGTVTVTDTASTLNAQGLVQVGGLGTGTLAVANGGKVTSGRSLSGSSMGMIIGDEGQGAVTVSGSQSELDNNGRLIVGLKGTGTLTIGTDAIVHTDTPFSSANAPTTAAPVEVGLAAGSSGDVELAGGGTLDASNSAVEVGVGGTGKLSMDGGTLRAASLMLGAAAGSKATVTLDGGLVDVQGAVTDGLGAGTTITVDGGSIQASGGVVLTHGPSTSLQLTHGGEINGGLTLGGGATASADLESSIVGPITLLAGSSLTYSGSLSGTAPINLDGGLLHIAEDPTTGSVAAVFAPIDVSGGTAAAPSSFIAGIKGSFHIGTGEYTASLNGPINFEENSTLYLSDVDIGGPIEGFDTTDTLILNNFDTENEASSPALPTSAVWKNNVLYLMNGGAIEQLSLVGNYQNAVFHVATDAKGRGIDLTMTLDPSAPTFSGTQSTTTTSEAPVSPFSGVTLSDPNANANETLTITLAGGGGTLSGSGLSGGQNGVYTLSGSAATVTTALRGLRFTPAAGQADTSATTTFSLSDTSSAYPYPTVNQLTTVTNSDPAVPPTIGGAQSGQTTSSEASVKPFTKISIGDDNANATETVTITLSGGGGALSGAGLLEDQSGVYTVSGTAAAVTAALRALSFTPSTGQPNSSATTTFTLSDTSSAYGTAVKDSTTTVQNTDPAVSPTIDGTEAGQTTRSGAPVSPFADVTIGDANAKATDTLTITLSGGAGTLSGAGLSGGQNGVYTLSGTADAITTALDSLTFSPAAGQTRSSTTVFKLSDVSSAYPYPKVDSLTTVTNVIPTVPPVIHGTQAGQATTSEAPIAPFSGVTFSDANAGATDTLTITLSGGGGTLAGAGLSGGQNGVYTLAGTATAVTSALQALSFTPTAGQPNTSATTTFALSAQSSAVATPVVDTTTSVIDTDPAVAPTLAGTQGGQTTTSEAPVSPFSSVTLSDPNAGASDTLTITLSGGGGLLAGAGLSGGQNGVYTLSGTAAAVTSALQALTFTPAAGEPGGIAVTSFALSDQSSAIATPVVDTTTSIADADPPVAPILAGTQASATTSEAPVSPFSGVTLSDPNAGATDTLTITLAGGGGTLAGAGLASGQNGVYTLSGTAAAVTSALEALSFTPTAGQPGSASVTVFTLLDQSSAGTSVTDSSTSVTDTAASVPAAPPVSPPVTPPVSPPVSAPVSPPATTPVVPAVPAPIDSLTLDNSASSSGHGVFQISGQAASSAGVAAIEMTALVDGVETDLGAATLNPDGSFSFLDSVGAHQQSAITATLTDGQGSQSTALASFVLTAGIGGQPYGATEDNYDPTTGDYLGTTYVLRNGRALYHSHYATDAAGDAIYTYNNGAYFSNKTFFSYEDRYASDGTPYEHSQANRDGTHDISVLNSGFSITALGQDSIDASGQSSTTFVFHPGFGQDVVTGFQASGAGHDTLALSSADFHSLAQVLRETQNTAAGALITDGVSGDSIMLAGVTKAELASHPRRDISLTA